MDRLTALVERMATQQASGTGRGEGISATWAVLAAVAIIVIAALGIAIPLVTRAPVAPEIVQVPVAAAPAIVAH